jgi:hypothetical protein
MAVDANIIKFLSPEDTRLFIYIHRTSSELLANKIMAEGLEFYESLHNTTDIIINDPVHIQYWLKMREHYGEYTMVISIKRDLFFKYLELIKARPEYPKLHIEVEQLLTSKKPYINANEDKIFTLSHHFIKGYFNHISNQIVLNPDYDSSYDSPVFKQNLLYLSTNQ